MTGRLTALRELAEKVEAGVEYTFLPLIPAFEMGHCQYIHGAYLGSLDAAMALHESVLPIGWFVDIKYVNAPAYDSYVTVGDNHEVPEFKGQAEEPARAWLLAIIRALIAELETDHD